MDDQVYLMDTRFSVGTDVSVVQGVNGVEETLTTMDIPTIDSQFVIG